MERQSTVIREVANLVILSQPHVRRIRDVASFFALGKSPRRPFRGQPADVLEGRVGGDPCRPPCG